MMVGTEGTTPEIAEQTADLDAERGSPRNQNEGQNPAQTGTHPAQSAGQGKKNSQAGGDGGQAAQGKKAGKTDQVDQGDDEPTKVTCEDPAPPDPKLKEITKNIALAEAMKPIEGAVVDYYSSAPEKVKARQAITEAYKKAVEPGSALSKKFKQAQDSFNRAVLDMDGTEAFKTWLANVRSGYLHRLICERVRLKHSLRELRGRRENRRAKCQERTKRLSDRYAEWASAADKISAQVDQYIDKIDKLNSDINNDVNPDLALTSFWFEVAPKHLQLQRELDEAIAPVVEQVTKALPEQSDLRGKLKVGGHCDDHRLFFIDPANFEQEREDVLKRWQEVADDQAEAEADFKLQPDDAASLKQRWDKLKDDAWLLEAKAQLEKAA